MFEYLAEKGYDTKYGARYLQRVVREQLIVPMAYTLNHYDYDDQLVMKVVMENGEIEFHTTSDPMAFDLLMEQWDKLTLADQASFLRRKMLKMQEGPLYMRMQSEIDMMEVEKNSNDKEFWADLARSNLYTNLLNAKEKSEMLGEKINQLEIEISLAAMEQGPFDPNGEERIESWQQSFFNLLLTMFNFLYPENSTCYLSIYGPNPRQPLKFYLDLVERKQFEIKNAQAIWHREGFIGIDDDNPLLSESEKQPSPFIKRQLTELSSTNILISPTSPNDTLYGVELCISGPACLLYFTHESGIQQWRVTGKDELENFSITISDKFSSTPFEIVRQQFYQMRKPMRIMNLSEIKDLQLGINIQIKPKEFANYIGSALDEIFEKEIESLVI